MRPPTPKPEVTHDPCGWPEPGRIGDFKPCITKAGRRCQYNAIWRVITHGHRHGHPYTNTAYYCWQHLPERHQP